MPESRSVLSEVVRPKTHSTKFSARPLPPTLRTCRLGAEPTLDRLNDEVSLKKRAVVTQDGLDVVSGCLAAAALLFLSTVVLGLL